MREEETTATSVDRIGRAGREEMDKGKEREEQAREWEVKERKWRKGWDDKGKVKEE